MTRALPGVFALLLSVGCVWAPAEGTYRCDPLHPDQRDCCSEDGWCVESILPAGDSVRSLFGAQSGPVWAVGNAGLVLEYDGAAWSPTRPVEEDLNGVWSSPTGDAWAVGANGRVLHLVDASWKASSLGSQSALLSVYGNDRDLWIGGEGALYRATDLQTLVEVSPGFTLNWTAIEGAGPDEVYMAGVDVQATLSRVLKWQGGFGTQGNTSTAESLRGVWTHEPGAVWVVGTRGELSRWTDAPDDVSLTEQNLNALFGTPDGDLWVAGDDGTLLRKGGTGWALQQSGTHRRLNALWGRGNDLWAAGEGLILHRVLP